MDPKTTKRLLKEANDAIKKKDFAQADELTSRILMFDGRNYNALVFRGLCREHDELAQEALACYRSAVEVKPEAPLGWQALVSFFEKRSMESDNADRLEAYRQLLRLGDPCSAKRPEVLVSCLQLMIKMQLLQEAVTLAENEVGSVVAPEPKYRIQLCLLDLYKRLGRPEQLMAVEEDLIFKSSSFFLEDPAALTDIIRSYVLSLRKSNLALDVLRTKCSDVLLIQPDHAAALETSFLLHFEALLMSPHLESGSLAGVKEKGSALAADHPLRALLHGLDTWLEGHPEVALAALEQDAEPLRAERWRVTVLLRTRLAAAIHRVQVCREAHTALPGPHQSESIHSAEKIARAIQFFFWQCCVTAGDCGQVELICRQELPPLREQLIREGPEWRVLIASMRIITDDLDDAAAILDGTALPENVFVQEEMRLCRGRLCLARNQFEEVLTVLEADDSRSEALLLKGKALWALERHEDAFCKFKDAAERDPFSWEAFLFIGRFCEQQKKWSDARAAYRHSFNLNRNSQNGQAWCDFFFKRHQYKEALKILERVTKEHTNLKWAWFRKGNIHSAMKNPSDAMFAYQNAISCDKTDPIVYDCLGDCNSTLGSNETAVKNYKEALKIDPHREYSQMRVAVLLHKLGQYQAAVVEYNKALKVASPGNQVQIFKGLGDTYLSLATSALQERLVKLAVAHTEKAVRFLTKAFSLRPQFLSILRPLADALLLLHAVPNVELQISVPAVLLHGSFAEACEEEEQEKTVDKEKMLQLSARLYASALKLRVDCADTWCCLGFALLQCFTVTRNSDLVEQAESCVRHAIRLQPEETAFWNLLGVVYSIHKQTLFQAQHCFIQAIQLDSMNAVAWSNLGFFYLINDQLKLAHDVFCRSQSADTLWMMAWVGQGRIARETEDQHEALDLFRHSLALGHTEFGALSYARMLLHFAVDPAELRSTWFQRNVVLLNAFTTATAALEHSLELDPRSRLALLCQALLSDHLGNSRKAEKCIQRCLDLSPSEDACIRLNALRILEFGKDVKDRLELPAITPNSVRLRCIFGYLEAKRGHLERAIEHYEEAITLSESGLERAEIAAAVGFHAFAADPDSELASEWLFRSDGEEERSPHSILGFAALSVLTEDHEVASCLLSDLMEMENDPHAAYMQSLLLRMTISDRAGQRALLRAIFLRPADARLWHYLARYLLTSRDEEHEAGPLSAMAAQAALALRPTLAAHARLLGVVFRHCGDYLGHALERKICGLFRLQPTDPFTRANIAAVARRESDHAERGAVSRLRTFASAVRKLAD